MKFFNKWKKKQAEIAPEKPDKPYYVYTGPLDSREKDNWTDNGAYRKKLQKAPTGSIHIVHPEIEMLCRVTENHNLPGFIITCKDRNGMKREFHLFLMDNYVEWLEENDPGKPMERDLMLCTSNETNRKLGMDEHAVRARYRIPFYDGFRCRWENEDHICMNGIPSAGTCQRPCSHYEKGD